MGRQTLDTEDRLIYETISLSAWTEERDCYFLRLLVISATRATARRLGFRHTPHGSPQTTTVYGKTCTCIVQVLITVVCSVLVW